MSQVIDATQIFEQARFDAETSKAIQEIEEARHRDYQTMNMIEYEIMKAEEEIT